MPAGRPTKYNKEMNKVVTDYCLLGATDAELAVFFNVSEVTINAWKKNEPEFLKSIKEGKEIADAKVATSLYQKALNGDTTAQIFWLKNRKSKAWRDKQEHNITGDLTVTIESDDKSCL